MKMLQYQMPLMSNDGYIISNADIMDDTTLEDIGINNPPIGMTIDAIRKGDLDLIYAAFEHIFIDEDEAAYEDFEQNFQNILRGENLRWKIVCVKVSHQFLWLEFGNPKYAYSECVVFLFKESGAMSAKFRFEIEHTDNMMAEVVCIEFSDSHTTITELSNNRKREILLPGRKYHEEYEMVHVIEYYV